MKKLVETEGWDFSMLSDEERDTAIELIIFLLKTKKGGEFVNG